MLIDAGHIRNVSLKDHFMEPEGDKLVNGKIKINRNIFDVTFGEDGKVRAKFASGNVFSNAFRGKTHSRLIDHLQTQYKTWLDEQAKIAAAKAEEERITGGYKDNPDVKQVAEKIAQFRMILSTEKPSGYEAYLSRLDEIEKLAALRNTLTRVELGTECDRMVRKCGKSGFMTHFDDYTKNLDERGKKGYVLNMLDTIISGFWGAVNLIENGKTTVLDFLKAFDGACVEAKGDNVQDFLARAAGIVNVSKSDESTDLARSIGAELAEIAEKVRQPFYEKARAQCEAEVRATCAKKGITDEAKIKERIENKAMMIVVGQDDEVKAAIKKEFGSSAKFSLYDALAGAKRPLTEISKNPDTGKWAITTFKDKDGNTVMKEVSGVDIDKNFSNIVDMYLEDAFDMGEIETKTVTIDKPSYATFVDLKLEGIYAKAADYSAPEKFTELANLVKAQLSFELDEAEATKFEKCVRQSFDEVLATNVADDPAKTKELFNNFASNYATNEYFDQKDDLSRLVFLVTSRTETLLNPEKKLLANLDDKIDRCVQMVRNSFPDYHVYTVNLKAYTQMAFKSIIRNAFHGNEGSGPKKMGLQALKVLTYNGNLFTDHFKTSLGHRAAGKEEVRLHAHFDCFFRIVNKFANVKPDWYMRRLKVKG